MVTEEIVRNAFANFRQLTGFSIKLIEPYLYKPNKPQKINMNSYDDVYAECKIGTRKIQFKVEIKNEIREMHIVPFLKKVGQQKQNWILISQYIPKPLKNDLKDIGINYLEASGNCYIRIEETLIYINDREVTPTRKTATGKIWNKTGLKFVFAILINPGIINTTYREIASKTGISLGSVGNLIDELQEEGFIEKRGEEFKITNKENLIDKWTELYPLNLRNSIHRGYYTYYNNNAKHTDNQGYLSMHWREIISSQNKDDIQWGGEPGGAILTKKIHPEKYTIYTVFGDIFDTTVPLKLKADANGEIEILNQFWEIDLIEKNNKTVVHPLLVYADLMISKDSRNHEIADLIKQQYLL